MIFTSNQLLDEINTHILNLKFDRHPKGLYAPVEYILSLGGKRIRPVLMLMAYNLYKDNVAFAYGPATGIEIYHNYTLLHDDLMDRADKRRGKPTVHKVWDDNTAILSGDAMLVLAYQQITTCPSEQLREAIELFSITALEICEGQQMDMNFEHRNDVSEAEYIEMIRLKTAVLLATSLKIGAMLGGASTEDANLLYQFGIEIGIAFQLQDDLLDVYSTPEVFGKNIGGDILCNKKTFMLIKTLELAEGDLLDDLNQWLSIDQYEPEEKIKKITEIYNQLQIRSVCEEKMHHYYTLAMENLNQVNVPQENKNELKQLMKHLMYRKA